MGSSDPVDQQSPSSSSSSSPSPSPTHTCRVCNRSFTTKTGLGVHIRRAHPDVMDQMQARADIKARWSEEEIMLLARKEAEFTRLGNVKFMNQALADVFRDRTVEAIKKARQKPPYRDAVRRFLEELEAGHSSRPLDLVSASSPNADSPSSASAAATTAATTPASSDDHLLEFLLSLPPPHRDPGYNCATLFSIIDQAGTSGKDVTLSKLASYLLDIFPPKARPLHSIRREMHQPANRRQRRRREYALTQRNFYKHQGRCIKEILEGPNVSSLPPREVMEPYWRAVMERECTSSPPNEDRQQFLDSVWNPITPEEICRFKLPLSTSPGPDGITSRQLRAVPNSILARIYNLILWCGRLPLQFQESKTIFIPKKDSSIEPGDFRPITIPSVMVRHVHGILAKRLTSALALDPRQRGFRPTDGCADNITMVDLLLRHHKQTYTSCFVASLDVSKAFDSLSHNAIFGTLQSYGLPVGFIRYLQNFYEGSFTRLVGEGWVSSAITPKRGVRQGDPLSPTIFNMVIDRLLTSLPRDVGCSIGNRKTNALAFADDLLLCASTPQGLQVLLDHTTNFLSSCGMVLNSAKCLTLSIKGQPKQKTSIVEQRSFRVAGNVVPSAKRSDEWRYLGVTFTADGRCKYHPHVELQPKLDRLTRAPLKPQQRLHALRTVVIPQLYHKLTLGNVMIGSLNKTDRIIRSAVRSWLNLPKDVPTSFFHAPVNQGGLGIPSVRWQAPLLRLHRLRRIELPIEAPVASADTFLATEMDKAEHRLRVDGRMITSRSALNNYWSQRLHQSVDGFGLREAVHHSQAHRWIREPTRLLTGRDYVNCIRLRINALPSRSRTSRGRPTFERLCRAGCNAPETLNHIVQQCHRAHSARMDRHNSVVNYIERSLNNKGFTTIQEPTLITPEGPRKPDLIAVARGNAVVIDAQVVTDGRSLDEAHRRKAAYYNTLAIRRLIEERFAAQAVTFCTATLNWRGIWSKTSVDQLIATNVIGVKDTAIISTRVAIGSLRCFRMFTTSTSVNYRRGVG